MVVHVHIHQRTRDAFKEGEHPRGEGGKFSKSQQAAHEHLTSKGWQHRPHSGRGPRSSSAENYTHPEKPKHVVSVERNGAYHHKFPGTYGLSGGVVHRKKERLFEDY